MVHEQLMTQKITPKNSPEQGVDLSGKERTEKALLPLPISQPQLQELSAPKLCSTKDPIHIPFSRTSPHHLPQGGAEMRKWAQHSTLSPHQACVSNQKKKPKNAPGNDIFIKCTLNCSAQPCGTTETFSLPVRWVALHENWLFQVNSINTCHCFLMRQCRAIECTSTGKPALLSLPCLWWCCTCLTTLVQTLGEAESLQDMLWGLRRGEGLHGETCCAGQLCKPQIPQSTVPVQCLTEGTVHSHPQSNAVLK